MFRHKVHRAGRFSMIHAAVLIALIGLAQVIGPLERTSEAQVSKVDQTFSSRLMNGSDGPTGHGQKPTVPICV